jgi:L-rhamnose mutarotase
MSMKVRAWFGVGLSVLVSGVLGNLLAGAAEPPQVVRYGTVIGVKDEKLAEYKRLHAAVWPEVDKAIYDAHIGNMTIFLRKLPNGKHYLFMYLEYTGSDFVGDMKKMADNPIVQKWWKLTDPCQEPLPDRKAGEWWATMEELCHHPKWRPANK